MDFISIDTETGGTRPGKHALLSIAAVASWDVQNPLTLYLWPADETYTVEAEAAAINGFAVELWKERGAMLIFEAMATLADWLKAKFKERPGALMLAHNAGFDRMFLDEAASFTGIRMPIRHAWRCSMNLMGHLMDKGLIPAGKVNLARLGELSGQWPVGGRPAVHEAGGDALACLIGYQWLLEVEQMKGDGISRIYAERLRQINVKGFTAEHDDGHAIGELCSAAGAYLFAGDCLANAKEMNPDYDCTPESLTEEILDGALSIAWPFKEKALKVSKDPIRNLEKAGAFVVAEIERLLRKRVAANA